MTDTEVVRRMFEAYLSGDEAVARELLAEDYTFTSPQDDHIDRAAVLARCVPTAERGRWQEIRELVPAGEGRAFVLYEYELKTGERHRNVEHAVVRDGRLVETHVFFGGRYDP